MLDKVKLVLALSVFLAAIVGYYVYAADIAQLYRVLILLAAVGIAVSIAITTERGRFVWSFVGEARTEVRKVVWPNRKETTQTTMLVMLMVVIVAIFLWLLDWTLGRIVEMFVK